MISSKQDVYGIFTVMFSFFLLTNAFVGLDPDSDSVTVILSLATFIFSGLFFGEVADKRQQENIKNKKKLIKYIPKDSEIWITEEDIRKHGMAMTKGRGGSMYADGKDIYRPTIDILNSLEKAVTMAVHINQKVFLANNKVNLSKDELELIERLSIEHDVTILLDQIN